MARLLFASTSVAAHSATPRPIVRTLVERGHEVVWYAGAAYAAATEATGARHVRPVDGHDFSVYADPYDAFPRLRGLRGPRLLREAFTSVFVDGVPGQVRDIERILDTFDADLVVADTMMFGPAIVHARGGPRFASLNDGPLAWDSPDVPPFGPGLRPLRGPLNQTRNRLLTAAAKRFFAPVDRRLAEVRAELGVSPEHAGAVMAGVSPHLFLQGTVPSFEYPVADLPSSVHFVGPFLPEAPAGWTPPAWWDQLDGDPPIVHVTQGTVRADPNELIGPALRALADEDVLVVATTGGAAVERLGVLPANARTAPFIPYAALHRRASVFVTNGGYIGVSSALAHGVPILQAGNTEEKAEIGAHIRWSGAGLAMRAQSPRPQRLRRAVRRLLDEPRFGDAARRIALDMAHHDTPSESADLLERLVAERHALV